MPKKVNTPAKKAQAKKPAPQKAKSGEIAFADPAEQQAFEQGMAARHSCIAKEDAPHGDGPLLKQWLKGWQHADG